LSSINAVEATLVPLLNLPVVAPKRIPQKRENGVEGYNDGAFMTLKARKHYHHVA
jgi:hypothetical protein